MVVTVAVSLRTRFDSPCHLQLVRLLLTVLSEEGDGGQLEGRDWKKLYKSVWSHSEFAPIMSNERDEKTKGMFGVKIDTCSLTLCHSLTFNSLP